MIDEEERELIKFLKFVKSYDPPTYTEWKHKQREIDNLMRKGKTIIEALDIIDSGR